MRSASLALQGLIVVGLLAAPVGAQNPQDRPIQPGRLDPIASPPRSGTGSPILPQTATVINAAEVGGLQAALDALPATGGTVFVPAGRHVFRQTVSKRLAEGQHLFLVGNVFEEVSSPAISAGPGGGRHLIANNNIGKAAGAQIAVREAPGCLVNDNLLPDQ